MKSNHIINLNKLLNLLKIRRRGEELYDLISLLHTDLSDLESLGNFTFESKMLISQKYSSRIMNGSKVDMELAYKENIMPWEIEIFTAYSVIYNRDSANEKMVKYIYNRAA